MWRFNKTSKGIIIKCIYMDHGLNELFLFKYKSQMLPIKIAIYFHCGKFNLYYISHKNI